MARPKFIHTRLTRGLDALVKGRLWLQVLIALGAGVAAGFAFGPELALVSRPMAGVFGEWMALPGHLFLALIGMVIVPLASSSIILGIAGAGGGEMLRSVGMRLAVFITTTTLAAVAVGVALARAIRPGAGLIYKSVPTPHLKPASGEEAAATALDAVTRELPQAITNLIPTNITFSLVEQDMLAIVVFSLFIGVAIVNAGRKEVTRPLVALAEAVLEVSMTVIRHAMRLAPVAVFGLMAQTTATNGLATLSDLAVYSLTVLAGLAILLIGYLAIVALAGRMRPLAFLKAIWPVQLLAFSTSSSGAVMPLTMKTAVEKLQVKAPIAGAVVPLAATANMAGTALYQAIAMIFLAEIGGVSLSYGDIGLMLLTLTGASIGAPAAPGASIAILSATAASFGIPLTGLPLVLGVDRLLDMARTAVNVTGDLTACRVLSVGLESAPVEPRPQQAAPAQNSAS